MKKNTRNYQTQSSSYAGHNTSGSTRYRRNIPELSKPSSKDIIKKTGTYALGAVAALTLANQVIDVAERSVHERNDYIASITPKIVEGNSITDVPTHEHIGEQPAPTDIPVYDANDGTVRIIVSTPGK